MDAKEKAKHNRLLSTYGITLEEFNQKLKDQEGTCAICKKAHPRMCMDHIHVKGFKAMKPEDKKKYTRGILCFMCNTGIKGFEKTVDGKRNRQQLQGTYAYFMDYSLKGEDV
tara:strand:+ start:66 stop:401 length:336 start_codon:yes stop_codon:yes gene_type:complete